MLDWLELLVIIVLNGLVDTLLVAWVAGRRSKEALEKWLESPDSFAVKEQIFRDLWKVLNTPSIKVTRKVKETDDKGNLSEAEVVEEITPLQNVISEIGRFMMLKLAAMKGGDAKALRQTLEAVASDSSNPASSSMQSILAAALSGRKGGSPMESLIVALLAKYLGKSDNKSAGGGGSW